MDAQKRNKFYSISGWSMAGLCLILLLLPTAVSGHSELLDKISFAGLLLSIVPAIVLLVLNICFRRKKRLVLWIINGLLLILTIMPILAVSSLKVIENGSSADHRAVSQLGLTNVSAHLEAEYHNDGGFHGDGISMSVYTLDKEAAVKQIQSAPGWRKGPLDENVTILAYGVQVGENGQHGPYLTDLDSRTLVPQKDWAYWYFEDRQAGQETDARYHTDVLGRYSLNFTLALYDGAYRLYVFKMDT